MSAADVLVLKVGLYLTLGVHGSGGHAELARTSVHTSRLLTTAAKIINIGLCKNFRDCHSKEKQGRSNEGFNAEPITFAFCILHFILHFAFCI